MARSLISLPWCTKESTKERTKQCAGAAEPLLEKPYQPYVKQGWVSLARQWIIEWWLITTWPAYLDSPVSRRHMWKWFFTISWFVAVLQDYFYGSLKPPWSPEIRSLDWAEWCVLVSGVAAARLPPSSMWSDWVQGGIMFAYFIVCRYMYPAAVTDISAMSLEWYVLMTLGIHFSVVAVGTVAMLIFAVGVDGEDSVLWLLPYAVLAHIVDYWSAKIFRTMTMQRKSMEKLLDSATNGFCSIDRLTGMVCDASVELGDTLEDPRLVGKAFIEHLDGIASWSELLNKCASEDEELCPVLVTCRTSPTGGGKQGAVLFDAKIIPYASSNSIISLCIQVLGEKRQADLESGSGAFGQGGKAVVAFHIPHPADEAERLTELSFPLTAIDETRPLVEEVPQKFCLDSLLGPLSLSDDTEGSRRSMLSYSDTEVSFLSRVTDFPAHVSELPVRKRASNGRSVTVVDPRAAPELVEASTQTAGDLERSRLVPPDISARDAPAQREEQRHVGWSQGQVDLAQLHPDLEKADSAPRDPHPVPGLPKAGARALEWTSRESCVLSLMRSLRHWHVPAPPRACCRWHATVEEAQRVLGELQGEGQRQGRCNQSWECLLGWQCTSCLGMNKQAWDRCGLCDRGYSESRRIPRGTTEGGCWTKVSL